MPKKALEPSLFSAEDLPIPEVEISSTTMVEITPDLLDARARIVEMYEKHELHRFACELRYWRALFEQCDAIKRKEYLALLYRNNRKNLIKKLNLL